MKNFTCFQLYILGENSESFLCRWIHTQQGERNKLMILSAISLSLRHINTPA